MVDRNLAGVLEVHGGKSFRYRLDLAESPFGHFRVPNKLSWQKVFGHAARWFRLGRFSYGVAELDGRLVAMTNDVDQRIGELLCSRICHELVAGIAAINNGVELITEIDDSMMDEALDLIGTSARQSSARLQFYRMAYGFAGIDALKSLGEVRDLVGKLLAAETRIAAEIQDTGDNPSLEAGWGKLLMNLVLFGIDCLPREGKVVYGIEGGRRMFANALGAGAQLPSRYEGFPEPGVPIEDVTALNIHAFYTTHLAKSYGEGLKVEAGSDAVTLSVSL